MIAILTDPEVGGTFLNWTVHYLSGDRTHYHALSDQHVLIPDNPVGSSNAHAFSANHPDSLDSFWLMFDRLFKHSELSSIYFHPFSGKGLSQTQLAVRSVSAVATHTVTVTLSHNMKLYRCVYKGRNGYSPLWTTGNATNDPDRLYEDFVNYFFAESKLQWDQQQLTDVWDKREFIALNFNPYNTTCINDYIDSETHRYNIDTVDLWTSFDQSVFSLFEYLGLQIDQERYQNWLLVYDQWKKVHYHRMMFAWYYETIVNNIVQGIDFDLQRFDLDIRQEAAIQHALIYRHNLNLKTWQLEKFLNTLQLHKLLEPNIHDLSQSKLKDFDLASL